ncbi:MAG: PilN domain-containing protein [Patescibacteria group bacterium]|nr:PilN domain-containing protein [Patescibacteria group bacterium]
MDTQIKTSFIPKKPLATSKKKKEKRPLGILSFISIIIILGVGFWIGGLFIYKNILVNQKAQLSESLKISRSSFELNTVSELENFNRKVNVSKDVLRSHHVITPLFDVLEEITLPSVQFTKFIYQADNNKFLVLLDGLAKDYTSVALQSEEFNLNKSRYFKNVVFSDLTLSENLDSKGFVSFSLSFSIDPSLLSYENYLNLKKEEINLLPPPPSKDAVNFNEG